MAQRFHRRMAHAVTVACAVRSDHADDAPGVEPVRLPENSRAVWHLYALPYDAGQFHGLPRDGFLRAFRAEGVPCSGCYREQYYDGLLDEAINSRGFKRLFPAERLKAYRDSFEQLKGNKQGCQTSVGMLPFAGKEGNHASWRWNRPRRNGSHDGPRSGRDRSSNGVRS